MFTKEIVGVANGLVGGWGNVGGGATQLVMGTALVSLLLVLDMTIYTFQYTFIYTYSPIFYLCNSILFSSIFGEEIPTWPGGLSQSSLL